METQSHPTRRPPALVPCHAPHMEEQYWDSSVLPDLSMMQMRIDYGALASGNLELPVPSSLEEEGGQ